MVRTICAVCVAFLLIGWNFARMPSAHAHVFGVVPSNPTTQDSVTIWVAGGFGVGCWRFVSKDCHPPDGDQIVIDSYTLDWYEPGMACPAEAPPYAFTCEYGNLPSGHYVVTVTEHHESLRTPAPHVHAIEFDVLGSVSVEGMTWGAIKALFPRMQ